MLARHVWRLTHDTGSLFYKVFKTKYFPNGSVFEAKSATGSFAWKSIIRSKNLNKRNGRWRMGDGKTIRIFQDAWLPNSNAGRILFHRGGLALNSTTIELIDPNSGWWNLGLIDQCFYPPDAQIIISLPLCITPQTDSFVWPAEKNGSYSVKSGYKILCEEQQLGGPLTEATKAQRNLWKGVWKLKVLGKIKHFLWKSCTNSLPTKDNLMKRTILQENMCHLCPVHPEDVKHALWGCSKVRQVWQRCFGWLVNTQDEEGSFSDLVQLAQTKPRLFPLFAVTAWTIWHHRNKSRLQAATLPLDSLADFVGKYLQIYADRNVKQMPHVRSVASTVRWSPSCVN